MDKNSTYNCVIIDDEPIALRVVSGYVDKIVEINVVGSFTNALDALKVLRGQKVDLKIGRAHV